MIIRGLTLRIFVPVVSDHGDLIQIAGVVDCIVQMPQLLLEPRGFGTLFIDVRELPRIRETRSRSCRGPDSIMRREVPHRRAAHAEAAHQQAIFVDRVVLLHVVHGLEQVHFAGKLVGVAVASVKVQDDGVGRLKLSRSAHAVGDEVDFAKRFSAAVKPCVEAEVMGRSWEPGRRNHQSIRLHAAVDLRDVGAHHEPGLFGPRGFTMGQGVGSRLSFFQDVARFLEFTGVEKFIAFERKAHSLVEDQNVGQQGIGFQTVDTFPEPVQTRLQFRAHGSRNGDARRRHRPDRRSLGT